MKRSWDVQAKREESVPLKQVTAVIRDSRVQQVLEKLRTAGVTGVTVSHVKGFGEYINNYSGDGLDPCSRVEVILEQGRAHPVAELIMDAAHTGTTGDGIVSIVPVEHLYRIRDKCEIIAND